MMAVVVLFFVLVMNRLRRLAAKPSEPAPVPETKTYLFCFSAIPVKAVRCPNCPSRP